MIKIPLIVGGGIRSAAQIETAFKAGADIVVIGTAIENDVEFLNKIKSIKKVDTHSCAYLQNHTN